MFSGLWHYFCVDHFLDLMSAHLPLLHQDGLQPQLWDLNLDASESPDQVAPEGVLVERHVLPPDISLSLSTTFPMLPVPG